jgi:hypothetical protein
VGNRTNKIATFIAVVPAVFLAMSSILGYLAMDLLHDHAMLEPEICIAMSGLTALFLGYFAAQSKVQGKMGRSFMAYWFALLREI